MNKLQTKGYDDNIQILQNNKNGRYYHLHGLYYYLYTTYQQEPIVSQYLEMHEQKVSLATLNEFRHNPFLEDACVEIAGYYKKAYGHFCKRESFREHLLIYCINGKGRLKTNTFSKEILPGELFFCLPNAAHFYETDKDDPWTIYWIHFNGNKIHQLLSMMHITPVSPIISIGIDTKTIDSITSIVTLLSEKPDLPRLIYSSGILLALLGRLSFLYSHQSAKNDDRIDQSINFMMQNFMGPLRLEQLAKQTHMSASNYSYRFKTRTGMSPIDYFIGIRMQKAEFLLRESNLPLKKIAQMLGYKDEFYFSRLFKKNKGMYPSHFRKNQLINTSPV